LDIENQGLVATVDFHYAEFIDNKLHVTVQTGLDMFATTADDTYW